MKVRFFERAKGLIRLGCSGLAVLLLASASSAATPGWEVQIINVTGTLDTTTKTVDLLDGNIGGYGTVEQNVTRVFSVVDLAGGGGNFGANFPYPNGVSNQTMNDFAVRAKANVVVPAGVWSIAFGSDDGGRLAFDTGGITFDSTFGENGATGTGTGEVRFEAPRGHSWTGGSFTVAAPTNASIVADMYERGGGDSFEVAIASGAQTGFGSPFQLLRNGTLGWQVTTNSAAPVQRIQIAGAGTVGSGGASVIGVDTNLAAVSGTPNPGLTHRWYAGYTGNYNAVLTNMTTGTPATPAFRPSGVFSQWWSGSDAVTPSNTVKYPFEIDSMDPQKLGVEAGSYANYSAVLTGQILFPENGVYKFKDGVDDYTSLRIDLNNNGIMEASEHLINDSAWTSLDGTANGGSPIVSATVSGVAGAGSWLAIEFVASEGGGGDSGMLMWDYDPAKPGGTGIGKGTALGFPTSSTAAPGADIGATPADALDDIAIPDTHLRTHGVRAITGGTLRAELEAGAIYAVDVQSLNFHDKISVGAGNLPASFARSLNMNGATLEVQGVGDLVNGDTIKIVDAQSVTGTANITLPAGTTWDTSNFATTGEIKLLTGGRNLGGTPGRTGDFDSDDDVDSADLLTFLEAWTGARAGNKEDVPGRANLIYNPETGEVTLEPGQSGKISGFTLANVEGKFKPKSDEAWEDLTPWDDSVYDNTPKQMGGADLADRKPILGKLVLGEVFPPGLDLDGLEGFLSLANFSPGRGQATQQFDLIVVPEPSTLALLGLGVLGFVNSVRRRRSC